MVWYKLSLLLFSNFTLAFLPLLRTSITTHILYTLLLQWNCFLTGINKVSSDLRLSSCLSKNLNWTGSSADLNKSQPSEWDPVSLFSLITAAILEASWKQVLNCPKDWHFKSMPAEVKLHVTVPSEMLESWNIVSKAWWISANEGRSNGLHCQPGRDKQKAF